MAGVKVCRVHRTLKSGGYCRPCRADRERTRYNADPLSQRLRKRREYHRTKPESQGDFMLDPDPKVCDHEGAVLAKPSDLAPHYQHLTIYACILSCGAWLDESGEVLTFDPTTEAQPPKPKPSAGASQAGKALAPRAAGQASTKAYSRDKDTMIEVPCSWPVCPRKNRIYPQNKREKNWCGVHQPIINREQTRVRQRRFRMNHGR